MSNMLKCSAPECCSNTRDNPNLKFYDLKTMRARLAERLAVLNRWNVFNNLMFGASSTSRNICENHFPNNETPESDAALCFQNDLRIRQVKVKNSSTQTSTTPSRETRAITIRIPSSQTPQLLIISNANPEFQARLVPESDANPEAMDAGKDLPANFTNPRSR
ncbi:hypothetical protein MSG28_005494 [Choristoneura fumiferana]|uniref:Uncharacterized protein n=1 Tax=Choristoneura fumiferana TaxID=7141 RepID=A0ACC0KZ99_CHOFU|nr:hypothetical protein MSG28_005494 [Choristoneura fumiferana]